MSEPQLRPCTAFDGHRRFASGPLREVALAVKRSAPTSTGPLLVFDDATGKVVDLDLRGDDAEVLARLPALAAAFPTPVEEATAAPPGPRGRGRPRLGVVAREVTLLPRHWEWLATQPGGASVALRKLVDQARRESGAADAGRQALETAYRVMSALAGDLPGFEQASRALFARDPAALEAAARSWPADVSGYVTGLSGL